MQNIGGGSRRQMTRTRPHAYDSKLATYVHETDINRIEALSSTIDAGHYKARVVRFHDRQIEIRLKLVIAEGGISMRITRGLSRRCELCVLTQELLTRV